MSENQTAVRFEHSPEFPRILRHLRASLAITTYQAGKLAVVGVDGDRLDFSFHHVDQAMGIAVGSDAIAVGRGGRFMCSVRRMTSRKGLLPSGRLMRRGSLGIRFGRGIFTGMNWPGDETACGLSTRCSRRFARWTRTTASCRAGDLRLLPSWKGPIAVT